MPNSGRVGKAQEQAIVRHARANDLLDALQAAIERAREQRKAERQAHTNEEER